MAVQSSTAYRVAFGLAMTAAFLIVFMNAAAGMLGIEDDDPANLLYVGVLAIGFFGGLIARFQPGGLSRAMFATALAQALVGGFALNYPNTASPTQIVVVHGLFVALFAGSALLFRHAARQQFAPAGAAVDLGLVVLGMNPGLHAGTTLTRFLSFLACSNFTCPAVVANSV